MNIQSRKLFKGILAFLLVFVVKAGAGDHHLLNGIWVLVPTRSDFAGEPAIQTGNLTIGDRQHHIYVSRTFSYDGALGTISYNFSMDGSENGKAKWDGDVLQVTTTEDKIPTVERYSLAPDGALTLAVTRPSHPAITLIFLRQ
jgi:hypothetical protein